VKKPFFFLFFFALVFQPLAVFSNTVIKETTCNVRYNSPNIVAEGVKCKALFDKKATLSGVNFFYTKTGKWYDWSVSQSRVEKDSRWAECIRYTTPEGNQWQICTVPSPQQLNIFPR